jgi:hypothetical protein
MNIASTLPTSMILNRARSRSTVDITAIQARDTAAEIFAEALIDDSNHELDWLWAASQLTDVVQRRYCLERALAINADSEMARRELGALVARSGRSAASATAVLPLPQLHITYSGYVEQGVELTGSMTIGRDISNDIVLAEATISRCHALLLAHAGDVMLVDLESANGTFMNGSQVLPDQPVLLADGDLIRMGRVTARYVVSFELK